jgi:hypothetical protein
MSISASTDIVFDDWKNSPLDVIRALLSGDWSNLEDGKIHYLPLHDNGSFNWKMADPLDWEKVQIELGQKIQLSESIGIIILSKTLETGGHFYFHPNEKTLGISWHINRKEMSSRLHSPRFEVTVRIRGHIHSD